MSRRALDTTEALATTGQGGPGRSPVRDGTRGTADTTEGVRQRLRDQFALAEQWRREGDYRRAGLMLTLTLGAAERLPERHSDLEAALCNELGVLCKDTGRFDRAERFCLRALDIYQGVHVPVHDSVATVYRNLSSVAHARGDYRAGEPLARRAVAIRTRLHGPDHPLVAADVGAWAALLDGCGRTAEAEARLREALRVLSRTGEAELEIMAIAHNLAALTHRRGDLPGAVHAYTHALGLKELLLGMDHPELAATLVGLATAERRLRRGASAAAQYRRAITVLDRRVDAEHPVLRAARAGLALVGA